MSEKRDPALGEKIRAHILKTGGKPGGKIDTEEILAKKFKVSRYQIRNVLSSLVQQGIISKAPRRGTFINNFDPLAVTNNLKFSYQISNFNLYEYIEARIVIELATLPLVVKRITPKDIAGLEEAVERMLQCKSLSQKADEADLDFHAIMLHASGNQLLTSFNQVVSLLFHNAEYRKKYWDPDTIERLAGEHGAILEAIKAGDSDLAVSRLKDHLHYSQKIELKRMKQ
jgi:GntR family transcriptional regulator, transcriptional repressor for pyruvate dehydrogenase complex